MRFNCNVTGYIICFLLICGSFFSCTVVKDFPEGKPFVFDNKITITGNTVGNASLGASGCFVNCTNDNEIYGVHSATANLLFCDGSVRAIDKNINTFTLGALITARGNEAVTLPD